MRLGKKPLHVKTEIRKSGAVHLDEVNNNKKSVSFAFLKTAVTTPNIRVTRLGLTAMGASSKLVVNEEKKFKGPLKKRPVDNSFDSIQQLYHKQEENIPQNMRSSQKIKVMHSITKDMTPDREEDSPPPTIAAGRSRRAIKPNPKYASEDMLTPKIIRNVVSGGTKTVTTPTESTRHRNTSSSSDDFFNNDSSDEMDIVNQNNDGDDGTDDIAYQTDEKDAVDSDFSEPPPEKCPLRPARGRGRPRKIVLPESLVHTTTKPGSTSSTRIIQIASSTVRSQPSQLQQLRRSLATSTAQRNLNLLGGEKRKLDNDGDANVPAKRKQLTVPSEDQRSTMKGSKENSNVVNTPTAATRIIRKIIPTSLQTLNDNKVIKSHTLANETNSTSSEKAKVLESSKNLTTKIIAPRAPLNKTITSKVNSENKLSAVTNTPGSIVQTQAKILAARATAAASKLKVDPSKQQLKDQSQSAAKITNNNNATITSQIKKVNSSSNIKPSVGPNHSLKSTSSTGKITTLHNNAVTSSEGKPNASSKNDFETMPTFTIVNVNDIINKKKDVLITKTKNLNTKTVCKNSITVRDEDELSEQSDENDKNETKMSTTLNSNRLQVETNRKTDTTTQHQILNHKIALRNARKTTNVKPIITTPVTKPAPRILNSMVAKKTRPVKPVISSLDDSADESIPLSMDDETEDEQENKNKVSERNNRHNMEEDESESSIIKQQQAQTKQTKNVLPVVGNRKRSPLVSSVSAKDSSHSLSAVKKSPLQTAARKVTPEKVVISRQGDKIIKKITCFETWYVINVKNERPHYQRSQFEMPLIKLANVCKTIPLPSSNWNCKVTLYELSVATLAKSTFITYTGDLQDHNIAEEDRSKYQPSCVMFRRAVTDRQKTRMPYDRAVIFKNKTFYTNIEGKNVKLIAAPSIINTVDDVEILLQIVDSLSLQSDFVEQATTMQ